VRFVQVLVPTGKREAVVEVITDESIEYAITDETGTERYESVITLPLPTAAVESVLDQLRAVGIDEDATTVVLEAETVVSDRFDELDEAYANDSDDTTDGDRIARDELLARANELAPGIGPFVLMTVVSAIVATAGLLLDSPAVVVGSMVIAPLIGPAMSTSVGTVVNDTSLVVRGIKLQVLGGILAIISAAGFAFLLRAAQIVPLSAIEVFAIGEVSQRLAPDVLSLVIALGAGAAGAVSLASGVSTALVGVMIAAALVPPTAVVGIGLAWGTPRVVAGSAVLVLVNFIAINLVALVALWQLGYRPQSWFRTSEARSTTLTRIAVLTVALIILSSALAGFTYSSAQTAAFEEQTNAAIETELPPKMTMLDLTISYTGFPARTPQQVIITVGYPPEIDPPAVADAIDSRIESIASTSLYMGPEIPLVTQDYHTAISAANSNAESTATEANNTDSMGSITVELRYVAVEQT
jgi:conserved hypothetical protein TIGR00341